MFLQKKESDLFGGRKMKLNIKGSVPFFTPKKFGLVYIISLVICAALRTYHVLSLIEPQTGFFSEKNFTVTLFYAVLTFSCLFCMVGAYLSRDIIEVTPEKVNGNGPIGIASLFLAGGFFLDFGYCLLLNSDAGEGGYGDSQLAIMMRSGSLPRKAEMYLAILSFVFMVVFAIMVLTKKYKGQMKIFSLVTVFWGVARLVTLFVRQISFVQVSDLFLEIASTVFVTLFFFSLCESLSGVYRKDAMWRVFGIGLPASLCLLTIQIPRFVAAIVDSRHEGDSEYIPLLFSSDYIINYAQVFAGILVIVMFIVLMKNTVKQKED